MKTETKYLAYEIIGHQTRYTTSKRQAEGLAAYHCGVVSSCKKLVPFSQLVSKFDEDYQWEEDEP